MRRNQISLLFMIAAVVLASLCQEVAPPSNKGTELPQLWDHEASPVIVPAPDGKLLLKVTGKRTGLSYPQDEWVPEYFLEQSGQRLSPNIVPFRMPRALWSPDSKLLAITSSDGGLVGNWKVYVYSVSSKAVIAHDVMNQVQADLARTFPAGINPPGRFFSQAERQKFAQNPSWVNVIAVRWLSNPDRLVVTASVPPSSGYGVNMGKQRGYVVDPLTGKVQKSFSGEELKKLEGGRMDY